MFAQTHYCLASIPVSPLEQKRITLSFLYRILGWGENFFIKDGVVYDAVVRYGSHSWIEEVKIRKATSDDYSSFATIEKIKKTQA